MNANKLSPAISISIAATLTLLVVGVSLYKRNLIKDNFINFEDIIPIPTTLKQPFRPTLYWFVDAETNSRHWWDFGARNSDMLNRGYLQVSLERLKQTQQNDYGKFVIKMPV